MQDIRLKKQRGFAQIVHRLCWFGLVLWAACGPVQPLAQEEGRLVYDPAENWAFLEPQATAIGTVQLHRTGRETALPIISLDAPTTLTLSFDLMAQSGQPLSIFFYHANQSWKRDLLPIEYLDGFSYDDLLDYEPSRLSQVHYVHYTYTFPNQNQRFLLSGNYILRVTEHGREDAVLFERPFFVTEREVRAEFRVSPVLLAGDGYPTLRPEIEFIVPPDLRASVFDFSACFARNAHFDELRCTDRPELFDRTFRFYLDEHVSFRQDQAYWLLDLSQLNLSRRILDVNFGTTPYQVTLDPDYPDLGGDLFGRQLSGQTEMGRVVRDVPEPETMGQYADVRFAYVPPGAKPLPTELYITGSFNGWRYGPAYELRWDPTEQVYTTTLRLKQGIYEYTYFSESLYQPTRRQTIPPEATRITAFIYYRDLSRNTDRLLTVRGGHVR